MAATLSAFTSATQGTLCQMQQHLAAVSAGVAALASGAAGAAQAEQHAALQQHLASVNAVMADLTMGAGSVQQSGRHLGSAGHAPLAPAPPPASLPGGYSQQRQRTEAVQVAPARQRKHLSSLHRSYDALQQQRLGHVPPPKEPQGQQEPQGQEQHLITPGLGFPTAAAISLLSSSSPTSQADAPCSPASCDSAYMHLLSSPAGGDQPTLRLLRCMAKSGPVWEHLSPCTGQQLMAAIVQMLQVGCWLRSATCCETSAL